MNNLMKLLKIMIVSEGREHAMLRVAVLALVFGSLLIFSGTVGLILDMPFVFELWIGLPVLAAGVALSVLVLKRYRAARSKLLDGANGRQQVLSTQYDGRE